MEKERRRSPRIMFSLPVSASGVDEQVRLIVAAGRTIILNRHGARVQLSHLLKPGQILHVVNQLKDAEADFRVVGPLSPPLERVGEWGIECLREDTNIWDIHFPPLAEEADARALLECRGCQTLALQPLSLVEVEVLETAGLLRLAGVAGENLAVLFDMAGGNATAVCFYELTRIHGSCRDTSTNLALDFNVVLDRELSEFKPDFAAAFEAPLAATPKKLGEMLALTGGPGGGDWKWGSSALQIGATVVQPRHTGLILPPVNSCPARES